MPPKTNRLLRLSRRPPQKNKKGSASMSTKPGQETVTDKRIKVQELLPAEKTQLIEPTTQQNRQLSAILTVDKGESLENCETPWDVCECLLHAMLGWLNYYQEGYLHRDVSIGNVLRLKERSKRKPFSSRRPILQLLSNTESALEDSFATLNITDDGDAFWNELLQRVEPDEQEIVQSARDIEKELHALGVDNQCQAILSDVDMAAPIRKDYFDSDHLGSISGTPEFMSKSLRKAVRRRTPYVQNPTDDMESFLWAALWAVVFNAKMPATSPDEREWQAGLRKEGEIRGSVLQDFIASTSTVEPYSTMVRVMSPILKSWDQVLVAARGRWFLEWRKVDVPASSTHDKELTFHKFAYSGVLDFVKVISSHREALINASQ